MYNVALLVERQLIDLDADQILALHEGVDDEVTYHMLLPVDSSPAALSASMTAFGGAQFVPLEEPASYTRIEDELRADGQQELDASAALLVERGQKVTTKLVEYDPIDALVDLVKEQSCDEVIILTEPHVVREFLHLDWTSRARRKLDVPTLHLLEHLTFDEQAEM
ncbi:universal stress protein [Aeromicrobium tamlense]|uniref:Nucleotide-binding universal stress UspA family protein n=1 Tax=Aeromicrobium tamlense TaxID=375541 RepID=A0A8I0KJS0_9ACTN|nr:MULTISPECIES: universal stress protein [Aeromicrobium]MBD1270331.1 universal stress protein [Aeromicrobium tamlense]MBD1271537.1 universal stress protein [Aeromicrobium tamlense]NYI37717.1 nucleotide-binding universal stress UspA family protein [Aeromicrobium tamlense]